MLLLMSFACCLIAVQWRGVLRLLPCLEYAAVMLVIELKAEVFRYLINTPERCEKLKK